MNDQQHHDWLKLLLAWVAAMVGAVTLSDVVLGATLVLTLLQIFVVVRREVNADRKAATNSQNQSWPPLPEHQTRERLDWSVEDIRKWERDHGT